VWGGFPSAFVSTPIVRPSIGPSDMSACMNATYRPRLLGRL
jgi:hypothetical protein